jgi:hypothetical protein
LRGPQDTTLRGHFSRPHSHPSSSPSATPPCNQPASTYPSDRKKALSLLARGWLNRSRRNRRSSADGQEGRRARRLAYILGSASVGARELGEVGNSDWAWIVGFIRTAHVLPTTQINFPFPSYARAPDHIPRSPPPLVSAARKPLPHPQAQHLVPPSLSPRARYFETGSDGMRKPIRRGASSGNMAGWVSFVASYGGWCVAEGVRALIDSKRTFTNVCSFPFHYTPLILPCPSLNSSPKCSMSLKCRAQVRPERRGRGRANICVGWGMPRALGCVEVWLRCMEIPLRRLGTR